MTDKMMRPSDWPDRMRPQDPVKQLFDRVFERRPPRDIPLDDPTVVTRQWIPHVDIKEEAQRFILYMDAPGVASDAIEVHMDQGVLTIKGERKTEFQESRDSYLRIERRYGAFHRRFVLPGTADPDHITVTARDGVVYVIIRKRPQSKSRQIRIGRASSDENAWEVDLFKATWGIA